MFAKSFFDLCVSEKCFDANNAGPTLRQFYEFGYRTVAINHEVVDDPDENENKKKKKKKQPREISNNQEIIPEPLKIEKQITNEFEGMTILKRLTVKYSSSDSFYKFLKSSNIKKYDILALLPTTMPALMFACSNIEADILTFDPEIRSPLRINRKIYNQLMNKGYYFEILYSPTIEDHTKRQNTIHVSHLYHTFGKSRNIIISSGATSPFYVRGPYDIINLGAIFGLNEQQSKDAVTHCASNLCKKAVGRCHGKSVMFVESTIDISDVSVIELNDSDTEEMEVDQPRQKKMKL
ncbi:hypothetical protein WA026_006768 [Henosepilachna vigintioctopunctata]|uniref:Uncharacterized protein n=1 Tax=Henosepilachna vigintioctopunctata TaxID=420089 RepID=A0AAW1UGU0_9CUCU